LNKTHGMKAEMRIAPALNQPCRLFDSVEKTDVQYWNPQQLTAGFIVLKHAKPELHGIECTGGKRLISKGLQIRTW